MERLKADSPRLLQGLKNHLIPGEFGRGRCLHNVQRRPVCCNSAYRPSFARTRSEDRSAAQVSDRRPRKLPAKPDSRSTLDCRRRFTRQARPLARTFSSLNPIHRDPYPFRRLRSNRWPLRRSSCFAVGRVIIRPATTIPARPRRGKALPVAVGSGLSVVWQPCAIRPIGEEIVDNLV